MSARLTKGGFVHAGEVVRQSVEETLNGLLDANYRAVAAATYAWKG